ncbi:MAG: helix-turn-helix domain-containing protein [Methylococcaceae bacterium]|nr:helix-turn-helix domain-containing protein [Methylococcaceae bacterium]
MIQALAWAFDVSGVRPDEKLVLLAIADWSDMDGRCFTEEPVLASRSCMTLAEFQHALENLERHGLVERTRRPHPKCGLVMPCILLGARQ